MTRWKLTLAYDGTAYHGWQVQPGLATVQATLATALERLTGERVLPQGSGRTDCGVHALGQVASFDLAAPIPATNLLRALNRTLPASIRVLAAEPAAADFHARHSAVCKRYEYRILPASAAHLAPVLCPPMLAPYVWDCPWPLDLDRLCAAAALVAGEHDFSSFAASDPDKRARSASDKGRPPQPGESEEEPGLTRTILQSQWHREHGLLVYRVTGSGFLHHMVRNLVGTFVECGRGRWDPSRVGSILAARDRTLAGPTAPARGLFLHSVCYDGAGCR